MRLPAKQDRNLLVIALVLALIAYSYVNHEVRKSGGVAKDPSYKLFKLTAKKVPVHVRFASSPPEGYQLMMGRVTVEPSEITLIGPEALIEETSSAETAILDISQMTRKMTKTIPLETVAGITLTGERQEVDVTIPIEKLEAR